MGPVPSGVGSDCLHPFRGDPAESSSFHQEHWGAKDGVRDPKSVMLPASHVEAPSPDEVSGAFGRGSGVDEVMWVESLWSA